MKRVHTDVSISLSTLEIVLISCMRADVARAFVVHEKIYGAEDDLPSKVNRIQKCGVGNNSTFYLTSLSLLLHDSLVTVGNRHLLAFVSPSVSLSPYFNRRPVLWLWWCGGEDVRVCNGLDGAPRGLVFGELTVGPLRAVSCVI